MRGIWEGKVGEGFIRSNIVGRVCNLPKWIVTECRRRHGSIFDKPNLYLFIRHQGEQ